MPKQNSKYPVKESGREKKNGEIDLAIFETIIEGMESRLRKDLNEIRAEIKKNNEEMKREIEKIRGEWKKKNEEMKIEMSGLKKRVTELERKDVMRERKERRNNIIVSGMKLSPEKRKTGALKQEVQRLLKQKQVAEVNIESAFHLSQDEKGNSRIVATLRTFEEKMAVMKGKSGLAGTEIYVGDDLTEQDRRMQKEVRDKAREERGKGKVVKTGFGRINIDGKWMKWSEGEFILVTQEQDVVNESGEK